MIEGEVVEEKCHTVENFLMLFHLEHKKENQTGPRLKCLIKKKMQDLRDLESYLPKWFSMEWRWWRISRERQPVMDGSERFWH